MENKLGEVLKEEVIKKVKLAKESGLAIATVSNIANKKANPTDHTKGTIVKAINKIIEEKKYTVADIFPA
jgi:DNA-binding XRE family transcriptional regulator